MKFKDTSLQCFIRNVAWKKKIYFALLKKTKKHMLNELILHQTNKRKEKLRTTNFFLFLNHSNIDQQKTLISKGFYVVPAPT